MANQRTKARTFNGMSYRGVQRANSERRSALHREDQIWLKRNDYRNVGWENVIKFYKKIEEFLDSYSSEDLTLEELFLEADRIGNKYLTRQETEEFNQKLSKEVNEIAEIIDQQFPDAEIEVIDFTNKSNAKPQKKRNQKVYKTVKL